jgi:cobalt-zinc-cadmium efflux system membrane fusion protein
MKRISLFILLSVSAVQLQARNSHHNCTAHDPAGHGHAAASIDIEIHSAAGGLIERKVTFPAEIRLNRDRFAAISPRYAGTVRELRAERGDSVKQGDLLALLENRETLAGYALASPLDGTVIAKYHTAGETISETSVLFEVADLTRAWAVVHIFPQYQQAVRPGTLVTLISRSGRTVEVLVEYVSPLISPSTRTVEARCTLQEPGEGFAPGSFARARLTVESVQASVRVEQEAVQTLHGEKIVFVQGAGGVELRDVETGLSDGDYIEIKAGLAPGELYVARGAFALKAEQMVSGLDPHAGHGH